MPSSSLQPSLGPTLSSAGLGHRVRPRHTARTSRAFKETNRWSTYLEKQKKKTHNEDRKCPFNEWNRVRPKNIFKSYFPCNHFLKLCTSEQNDFGY